MSASVVRLLVSLPSEITTSAFLRREPDCASGTASADRVVDRCAARRPDRAERLRHGGAILSPALHEHRTAVEAIQEHFVLRPEQIEEEAIERRLRRGDLLADHAAAGVERDAETHRHALGIELRDGLQLAVFVDEEVVLFQVTHESSAVVSDRHRHADELDARAKRKPLTGRALLRAHSVEPRAMPRRV